MKIILISQLTVLIKSRNETRECLDKNLTGLILASGYLPIPIPTNLSLLSKKLALRSHLFALFERLEPCGVLLPGGSNIGDCPERDEFELALLDLAEENKLPLLGICRGMQLMGFRAGSKMKPVNNHIQSRHKLIGRINEVVNSFHELALKDCPIGYDVLASSTDGTIEAIKHKSLPWQGWMWHPEREKSFKSSDIKRIKAMFL